MTSVLVSVGSDRTKLVEVPDRLDILGQTFLVEVVSDRDRPLGRIDGGDEAVGLSHLLRGYIVIRGGGEQGEDCLRDTVLHEVIHCIAHLVHVDVDEEGVAALTTGLIQVLRANPGLYQTLVP